MSAHDRCSRCNAVLDFGACMCPDGKPTFPLSPTPARDAVEEALRESKIYERIHPFKRNGYQENSVVLAAEIAHLRAENEQLKAGSLKAANVIASTAFALGEANAALTAAFESGHRARVELTAANARIREMEAGAWRTDFENMPTGHANKVDLWVARDGERGHRYTDCYRGGQHWTDNSGHYVEKTIWWNRWKGAEFLSPDPDYVVPSGEGCLISRQRIIAWMPLPAPPSEAKDDGRGG